MPHLGRDLCQVQRGGRASRGSRKRAARWGDAETTHLQEGKEQGCRARDGDTERQRRRNREMREKELFGGR